MDHLLLAPGIQEALLFLPPTDGKCGPVRERGLCYICAVPDWRKQRGMWGSLVGSRAYPC